MSYTENINTARVMRGMTQTELAAAISVTPQYMSGILSGARSVGPSIMPKLVSALGVDPAYIRGEAQTLPVRDTVTGEVIRCRIMRETGIDGYGVLYMVDCDAIGPLAVILTADGVQFTPRDWQGSYYPQTIGDIAGVQWLDTRGRDAVMMDGLPRVIWG